MHKNQLFLVSDIHLEHQTPALREELLHNLNSQLSKLMNNNPSKTPIVILAGDIGNIECGVYEWMSQIQATVIYVLGNHEFWGQDYHKTLLANKEKVKAYSNIHLLIEDAVCINDQVFVGTTLWTDCGKHLNSDLIVASARTMNDTVSITDSHWYQSLENKKHYLDTLVTHSFHKKDNWNNLIQIEENQKAVQFINTFYELWDMTIQLKQRKVQLRNQISFSAFINLLFKEYILPLPYPVDSAEKEILIESAKQKYAYSFNKLKKIGLDKVEKSIQCINVTHHHPFYEDIFLENNDSTELFYNTRKGHQYPYHNYFWEMTQGRVYPNQNLFEHIHYHNNGSYQFNSSVLAYSNGWVYGHKHYHITLDRLKGMNIASNPNKNAMLMSLTFKTQDNTLIDSLIENRLSCLIKSIEQVLPNLSEAIASVIEYSKQTIDVNMLNMRLGYVMSLMDIYKNAVYEISHYVNIRENKQFSYWNVDGKESSQEMWGYLSIKLSQVMSSLSNIKLFDIDEPILKMYLSLTLQSLGQIQFILAYDLPLLKKLQDKIDKNEKIYIDEMYIEMETFHSDSYLLKYQREVYPKLYQQLTEYPEDDLFNEDGLNY